MWRRGGVLHSIELSDPNQSHPGFQTNPNRDAVPICDNASAIGA